jgi:ribonuclease P protein component
MNSKPSPSSSVSFRTLFSFTKPEVDATFAAARLRRKIKGFTLLAAPATAGRLLIVIPRAVGKAHDRNLLRRRLKSIFYEERLFEQPFTFIVLTYKSATEWSFEDLKKFLVDGVIQK